MQKTVIIMLYPGATTQLNHFQQFCATVVKGQILSMSRPDSEDSVPSSYMKRTSLTVSSTKNCPPPATLSIVLNKLLTVLIVHCLKTYAADQTLCAYSLKTDCNCRGKTL